MAYLELYFATRIFKSRVIMTVKELINEVEFDDLLPYLKEIIVGHLDNIYAFREVYDILRGMKPNPEFVGKAWIEQEEDWVSVQSLDGDSWENELAKELVGGIKLAHI